MTNEWIKQYELLKEQRDELHKVIIEGSSYTELMFIVEHQKEEFKKMMEE